MEAEYERQAQGSHPRYRDRETGSGGAVIGFSAVLVGLLLIVAFHLPWIGADVTGFDQSGYDLLKEDTGSDNILGNALYDFVIGSSQFAGIGSVVFGLALAMGSWGKGWGPAFRAWASTGIGCMVAWAALWPCFVWAVSMLAGATRGLRIGLWTALIGPVLLAIISLKGLFDVAPSSEGRWAPSLSGYAGALAVLLGLILLVAFFLPWEGDQSAFEAVKEDQGDHFLGEWLVRLIGSSTVLAGLGSVILGLRLATRSRSNAASKAWAATSFGGMALLGLLWPSLLWAFALLGDNIDELRVGLWMTLVGAALLIIASLVGLADAFVTQREEGTNADAWLENSV